jgi:hypothetical protein
MPEIRNRFLIFFKDKRKKSILKMLYESTYLWYSKKEVPFFYFKYLYRKNVPNFKDYVGTKEAHRINHSAKYHKSEHMSIISNKLTFSMFCSKNNLAIPKLISYNLDANFVFNGKLQLIENKEELLSFFEMVFDHCNEKLIFIKPLSLYGGIGCFKISKDNLIDDINNCADFVIGHGCVHEEVVQQHPEINKIHAGCINTIRVETFIDESGVTHILSAFMRFGVGKSFVDNTYSGGFYIGIDLESETLKAKGHQYMEYGGAEVFQHPDSQFVLEGFKIPFFKEVCELVLKGVDYIPDRYIGWDIAVTPNGPIIIEANEYPCIFTADIAYGGYLNHPLYKEIIAKVS